MGKGGGAAPEDSGDVVDDLGVQELLPRGRVVEHGDRHPPRPLPGGHGPPGAKGGIPRPPSLPPDLPETRPPPKKNSPNPPDPLNVAPGVSAASFPHLPNWLSPPSSTFPPLPPPPPKSPLRPFKGPWAGDAPVGPLLHHPPDPVLTATPRPGGCREHDGGMVLARAGVGWDRWRSFHRGGRPGGGGQPRRRPYHRPPPVS